MPPTRCSFISRMITVGHLSEGGCHLIPRTPQTRRSSCQSHCTAIAKQVGRPSKQTSTSLIMRTITNGLKIRRRGCVMVVCVCTGCLGNGSFPFGNIEPCSPICSARSTTVGLDKIPFFHRNVCLEKFEPLNKRKGRWPIFRPPHMQAYNGL